jgi:hypothetical protein
MTRQGKGAPQMVVPTKVFTEMVLPLQSPESLPTLPSVDSDVKLREW